MVARGDISESGTDGAPAWVSAAAVFAASSAIAALGTTNVTPQMTKKINRLIWFIIFRSTRVKLTVQPYRSIRWHTKDLGRSAETAAPASYGPNGGTAKRDPDRQLR